VATKQTLVVMADTTIKPDLYITAPATVQAITINSRIMLDVFISHL